LRRYFVTDEEKNSISKFTPEASVVNLLLNFGLTFNQCAWLCKINNNDTNKVNMWMGENFEKLNELDNEEWNKSEFESELCNTNGFDGTRT